MADNVATALKNLNKELTEADVKIRAAQGDSQALFDAIVRGVGISKDAFRSLVSELSGTDIKGARTIDIVTRLVDENGRKLTPASIKATIENITKDNKPQTLGLFQYKTSDLNTLQQMLAMSKKDAADLLSTVLKISNTSVGLNKTQGTAYSNALASRIKEEARARNKIIKLQERQLQLEQAIDRASSNKSGKTKFEGQMRSVADLNKELAKTARLISQQNAILQGSGRGQNVAKALGLGTAKKEADMLNNSLSKTIGLAQRLGYAFGIAFSAQGLVQFGRKLVETRGEFELQQVALRSILQNKQVADEIWDKTMQAALQSPFTAMQLTKYTKQLAAYRIETEKLFDTTKRLADVSAGLGVDMQRLILAYGQVKAANYLRASEIRQFTEAGVNILGELSTYLSKTRGEMISTAQVMDMVQKRMVKFEDVEAIFKRMTDAGGIFYEMQYIQSQTVKGQLNKLHDAYDQMLNNIGKANQGAIRDLVGLLNNIVKNWREWKTVIDLIAWPLIISTIYKFGRGLMYANASAILTKKSINGVTRAGARMQVMMKSLYTTMASNPWLAIAIAIAAATVALINHAKQVKFVQDQIMEQNTRLYETQEQLKGYQTTIENNNKAIKDNKTATDSNKLSTDELNKKKEENREILAKLTNDYPELVKNMKLEEDGTITLTDAITKYNDELERQMTLKNILAQNSGGSWLGDLFSDTYTTNLTEYMEGLSKLKGELISAQSMATTLQMRMHLAGEDNLPFYGALKQIKDLDLSDIEKAAGQYRNIIQSLYSDVLTGYTGEHNTPVYERSYVGGAKKYMSELPQLSSFPHDAPTAKKAMEENADVFMGMFEESISQISDYEKIITEKYNGDVAAFIADNTELINKGIVEGNADVVSTIRTVLQTQGGATTKEAKVWYNKVLNEYLTFHNAHAKIAALEAQVSAEREKKYKNQDHQLIADAQREIEEIKNSLIGVEEIDFFASSAKTNTNGTGGEDGKGDKTKENASRMLSLIKEMRSEYDKLAKSAYGYAKSEATVRESYKQSVKEILGKAGITDYDFTTNAGMIAALEKVMEYATKLGPEAAAEVQKYIDQLETEITINAQVRIREDFGRQMEEAFNDYDLTLELQNLGISEDMAKNLFPDLDYTSIGKLQEIMKDFYDSRQTKDEKGNVLFSVKDLEEYRKWADKIDAEILKARKEKVKQYSKYLEKEYSERAKLEMKHAQDIAFVTANITDKAQRKNIIENINRKYQNDLNDLNWRSFKESDFYVEMMDDISSLPREYMQMMLDKIEEILQHPETLSPRALKEAINARQKVLEAQMNLEPLDVMRSSLTTIREAQQDKEVGGKNWKQTKENINKAVAEQAELIQGYDNEIQRLQTLQGELAGYEKALENLQKADSNVDIPLLNRVLGLDENGKITSMEDLSDDAIQEAIDRLTTENTQEKAKYDATVQTDEMNARAVEISDRERIIKLLTDELTARRELSNYQMSDAATTAVATGQTSTSVGSEIQVVQGKKDTSVKKIQNFKQYLEAFTQFDAAFAKFNAAINSTLNAVAGMGNAFYDMFDALGCKTDALTEGWKEFGNTMISSITNALTMIPMMVAAFTAAGIAINSAMSIIGLIAEALNLLMTAITAISKLHDAGYEKEIENQQKKIDELKSAYERLEKAIEKTWTTMSYIDTYNQQVENIKQQIEALEAQRSAENSKKNTDEDKIREYGDSIQEAYDELEELEQKRIEVFGGVGEVNYRSAAEEFVSAWKDAFLETGDGLEALQEHFDEFLQEWFVKQATMRIAGAMLERTFRMIDESVNESSEGGVAVTMAELQAIRDEFATQAPLISEALEELAGMWDLGNGEGSLSGLAAGIQGMTEEQANILEAYWNSVRMYTANLDVNVERIANILGAGGSATNPQLQQLQIIAQHTQAIHTLLDSVTRSGHPQGGLGIKVFNN